MVLKHEWFIKMNSLLHDNFEKIWEAEHKLRSYKILNNFLCVIYDITFKKTVFKIICETRQRENLILLYSKLFLFRLDLQKQILSLFKHKNTLHLSHLILDFAPRIFSSSSLSTPYRKIAPPNLLIGKKDFNLLSYLNIRPQNDFTNSPKSKKKC